MKARFTTLVLLILAFALGGCQNQEPASNTQAPVIALPTAIIDDPFAEAETLGYQIDRETGRQTYVKTCTLCHTSGLAGAPMIRDNKAWAPRFEKGLEALIRNSIKGYKGNTSIMSPRGGAATLTDDEVASALVYMVEQSQQ